VASCCEGDEGGDEGGDGVCQGDGVWQAVVYIMPVTDKAQLIFYFTKPVDHLIYAGYFQEDILFSVQTFSL